MRHLSSFLTFICLLAAVCFTQTSQAQYQINYYCGPTNQVYLKNQGSAPSAWTSDAIWLTNETDAVAVAPVTGVNYFLTNNGVVLNYGSNYVTLANGNSTTTTLMRNPTGAGTSEVFPGDSLTLNTNTQIRLKNRSGESGNGTNVYFNGVAGLPGLIMNGGFLNDGDNGQWVILGSMQVTDGSFSAFAPGGDFGNYSTDGTLVATARSMTFGCQMSGHGTLALILTATNEPVLVTNGLNTFNGNWIIQEGWLKGETPQCLGSANITVDPYAVIASYPGVQLENPLALNSKGWTNSHAILDFDYDPICTGTLILTNGGLMNLHRNCIFGSLIIEGQTLANGTYTYSQLTNAPYNFTNFLKGGSGQIKIQTPVAPPTPPGLATAASADGQITATWLPAATADGYFVSSSPTIGGTYTVLGFTNSLAFVNGGLTDGTTNYYEVAATNAFGLSAYSSPVAGYPEVAVTGLSPVVSSASVQLNWNTLAGASSYSVGRSIVSGSGYTTIASGLVSPAYPDSSIVNGTIYYYVVTAPLSNGHVSAPSLEQPALTFPSVPTLTAAFYGTNCINVELSVPDVTLPASYNVSVSTNGVTYLPLATLQNPTNFFVDVGVTPGSNYYFQATAQNASGTSGNSAATNTSVPVGDISVAFVDVYANGPTGYLADEGASYDTGFPYDGYVFGWFTNSADPQDSQISMGTLMHRNAGQPLYDQRLQAFAAQTQIAAGQPFTPPFPQWGILNVPNGLYLVHLVSGDQTATDSIYQEVVNGVSTSAFTPGNATHFGEWTILVNVTSNFLVLSPGSVYLTNNDKICYIDIYPAVAASTNLVAAFTLGPASGTAPLTVNFTNTTLQPYSSALWNFGDGFTSNTLSTVVTHAYTVAGTYNVSLIESNTVPVASTNTLLNAVTVNPAAQPVITNTVTGSGPTLTLNLSWGGGGQLLQATNVTGPWTTNVGAASPFAVSPTNARMFFRIQQ